MSRRIIISCNTSWGIYNFRGSLIVHWLEQGYEVICLSPVDGYETKLENLGVRHICFSIDNKGKNPLRDYNLLRMFKKLFLELKPDFVFNYTIKPVVFGGLAAKALGIPYYSFITGLGTGFLHGWLLRFIVTNLYRISQKNAANVFFLNDEDADLFIGKNLVPSERVTILPGEGIDTERFAYYPLPDFGEGLIFLYLGRVLKDKGVLDYIAAAKQVRSQFPKSRFLIVGDCDAMNASSISRNDLIELGAGEDFDYSEPMDDVIPVLRSVHCVVLPSYREGVPRTLLEASSMGRIVISSNVVGCKDVVKNGVTGLLCNVRDPEDLASKMKFMYEMSDEDITQWGKNGREYIQKHFAEEKVIEIIDEKINVTL